MIVGQEGCVVDLTSLSCQKLATLSGLVFEHGAELEALEQRGESQSSNKQRS